MERIRLADLARAAGVSQGTASNVFNRPERVRPDLRARVERVARELDYYGPDPAARMLRAGKVNAIGVVAPTELAYGFTDPYLRRFLSGVAEVCAEWGAGLSLVSARGKQSLADWTVRSAIVDGFVLHCTDLDDPLVALAQRRRLPFVAVDVEPGEGGSVVRVEDARGAYLAARHLLGLGHRHLAIFTIPLVFDGTIGRASLSRQAAVRVEVAGDRIEGYRRAVAEAGLDPLAVPMFETTNDRGGVEAALDEMLAAEGPMPTAILAMADRIALSLLELLPARGLPVPEAVSVVGFDGLPEATMSVPPLTTVAQPIEDKGRCAARMVLERAAPRREVLTVWLTQGASTAPPRA